MSTRSRTRRVEARRGYLAAIRSMPAPLPEYRPGVCEPLPAQPLSDQFAEMFANDPVAIAWRSGERLGELFSAMARTMPAEEPT